MPYEKTEQINLFNEPEKEKKKIDDLTPEEKERYRQILKEKLPELKKIEGFPIGEDEDILALSDPPYYTACPNPFIDEFIQKWQWEKHLRHHSQDLKDINGNIIDKDRFSPELCPECIEIDKNYHREPYTADVSEGKTHSIKTSDLSDYPP